MTQWTAARQAPLSFTVSWSLLKLMSTESVMPSNHFILYHPLLVLTSVFPSISVFLSESAFCIRWPKYWSFSWRISPSKIVLGCNLEYLQHGYRPRCYLRLLHTPKDFLSSLSLESAGVRQSFPDPQIPEASLTCCSVAKLCPPLCDLMDYSKPDSSVLHCLLEFAQIHVH